MDEYNVDVDGDGTWDEHQVTQEADGSVTITADMNNDGRADFVAHDYDGDKLVDDATYDDNFDHKLDTTWHDNTGDGYLDSSSPVVDPQAPLMDGDASGEAAAAPAEYQEVPMNPEFTGAPDPADAPELAADLPSASDDIIVVEPGSDTGALPTEDTQYSDLEEPADVPAEPTEAPAPAPAADPAPGGIDIPDIRGNYPGLFDN